MLGLESFRHRCPELCGILMVVAGWDKVFPGQVAVTVTTRELSQVQKDGQGLPSSKSG